MEIVKRDPNKDEMKHNFYEFEVPSLHLSTHK